MASQPPIRALRRVITTDAGSDERRGWLSHGLAALAISALGLAVAGSVALTTSAQSTTNSTADRPQTSVSVEPLPVRSVLPVTTPDPVEPAPDPALAAFSHPEQAASSRSTSLQAALVKEKAAQRAEDLAKTAEDVARTARAKTSDARQQNLSAAEKAQQTVAAQIAAANLQRAAAARVAATTARKNAESTTATTASAPAPAAATTPVGGGGGGGGVSPVPGAVIGAHFGQYGLWSRYHTGLDFRASYGTPIRAVKAGVVLYAGNSGDWAGNHVALKHADGKTTMSSHMSSMAVRAGQSVSAGQVIGYVGQTGRAFGAHLHFELYPAGVKYGDVYKAINPQPWLRDERCQNPLALVRVRFRDLRHIG